MKSVLAILCVLLLTLQVASATHTRAPTVVVTFGDSLTAGQGVAKTGTYPVQLEKALKKQGYTVRVINEGKSGETSSQALKRIPAVLARNPDIVVLQFGLNDALAGVPVEKVKENLQIMIEEFEAAGVTVILAGNTIGKVPSVRLSINGQTFDTGNVSQYANSFQSMYGELAEEYNITYIPFFLRGVAGVRSYNQRDYLHPTSAGYKIIAEKNVLPAVKKHLKK
jgi:acyl-CoA thioesterase I